MRTLLIFLLIVRTGGVFAQTDTLAYVLGRFSPKDHPLFTEIPALHASRGGMLLRTEALDAFIRMKDAAGRDGVRLRIISATRNFLVQKRIWEAKWNGMRKVNGKNLREAMPNHRQRAKQILKYSSMPGTSRHHWGTDIDINSLSPSYFDSGKGKKEYEWLRDNAHSFGFCQVYSVKDEDRPYGYEEERWHWSYMPIASKLIRFYEVTVKRKDINGFDGSDALPFSKISEYVMGIATECR